MEDYDDLIRRLDTAEDTWKGTVPRGRGMYECLFSDASSALKALVAERNGLGKEGASLIERLTAAKIERDMIVGMLKTRAEKAEADLSAARSALRDAIDGPWGGETTRKHAAAIEAARSEVE